MRAPRWLTRVRSRVFPAGSEWGWCLLFGGFAVLAFWQVTSRRMEQADRAAELNIEGTELVLQLQGRLGEYELALRGLRGFYEGSIKVEPEEFARYCQATDPVRRLPGLLTLNTLRRVAAADAARIPLWSEEKGAGQPPPLRPVYFPIVHRYPADPAMIGFDAGSTPVLAAALHQAEATDGLAVSAPVVFTNGAGERHIGFVMLLPYYPGGAAHRGAPDGFVELAIGASGLLNGLPAPAEFSSLHLVLRDDGVNASDQSLLEFGPAADQARAWRKNIPFGGRVWSLTIHGESLWRGGGPQPAFYFSALAVLLLSGLVAGLGIVRNRAQTAAASLRVSEQRARGLMDANLIGIFFTGLGERLLEANDAFLDLLGLSREDLAAGRIDLEALTPPEFHERTRLAGAELLQTGVARPFEKDYFHREGTRVSVLVGAARLATGREEYATFILDLTARKKTEAALIDNLLLLDRAQELAHLGIWQWDIAADRVHWSPELYRIYGLEPATFSPSLQGYLERVHPEDRARVSERIAAARRDHQTFSFEERILRPDGRQRVLSSWGGIRLDAGGEPTQLYGTCLDITDLRAAEAEAEGARAAHEKRSALLLAIARSPALVGDLPALMNAVTEAAAAGLDCARSSIWFFSDSGHAECADRYLAGERRHSPGGMLRAVDSPDYMRALAGGEMLTISDLANDLRTSGFAAAYLAPLGITASLVAPLQVGGELAGMLTGDHTGGPRVWTPEEQGFLSALAGLLVLARETGERRRAEGQLRALNEALEERVVSRTTALARSNAELAVEVDERRRTEADLERLNRSLQARRHELEALNEELETFSYSVSHDLRAPLRAIDGFSQALVEDFGEPLGVDGRNLLDRVRAGAKQMGLLIDGLLQLSRASHGEMRREPLDLSALARSVVNDLQAGDPARCPKVFIENDLHAEGDPALLRAVLQNLLGNAWKFTAGAADAEIHFSRADARRRPGFVVRDTGVGFDPAYAGKLFQPFQRLHRASDFPGTGIGLATVQRIIRRHSGRVWAESEPGKGAAFYFTLWEATSDLLVEKIEE